MGGMEAEFGFNIRCVSCPRCGGALNRSACEGCDERPGTFLNEAAAELVSKMMINQLREKEEDEAEEEIIILAL